MDVKGVKRAKTKNSKTKQSSPNNPPHYESIDEVWKLYYQGRKNGNGDVPRNRLVEHYRHLVKYAAERLYSKMPWYVDLDDLISSGIFGLIDAIESYDPSRGVKFITYSWPRIKGSILDELRVMDWVPRLVRARSYQLRKATQSLKSLLGREPTEKELAKELNMNMEEFNRLQRDAHAIGLISLDTEYEGNDRSTKKSCERDYIKDTKNPNPLVESQKKELKNILTKGLTRAERLIMILYYYEEMTMKEIGKTLDLSESRVSQMHSIILARIKSELNSRKRTNLEESLSSL